jgi:hypothetical protein
MVLHFNYQYIKKPIVQSMCFFGDKFCCFFDKKIEIFLEIFNFNVNSTSFANNLENIAKI